MIRLYPIGLRSANGVNLCVSFSSREDRSRVMDMILTSQRYDSRMAQFKTVTGKSRAIMLPSAVHKGTGEKVVIQNVEKLDPGLCADDL